jgi:tetratricopeptide (TPR) repeat protein
MKNLYKILSIVFLTSASFSASFAEQNEQILNTVASAVEDKSSKIDTLQPAQQVINSHSFLSNSVLGEVQAFFIFGGLVKPGKTFSEAIQAAQQNFNNDDWSIRTAAFKLFINLVEKGQAFTEATQAAQQCINSDNCWVRAAALYLFEVLVKQGQAFDEALQAVQQNINNDNALVSLGAEFLLKALVKKDQANVEAIKFVFKKALKRTTNLIYKLKEALTGATNSLANKQLSDDDLISYFFILRNEDILMPNNAMI